MPPRAAPAYPTWPGHQLKCSQLGTSVLPPGQALFTSVCSAPDASSLTKLVEHVTKIQTRNLEQDRALIHLLVVILMTQERPLRKIALKALSQLTTLISGASPASSTSSSTKTVPESARSMAHGAIEHHLGLWVQHMAEADETTPSKAAAFALGLVNLFDEYPQPLFANDSVDAPEAQATAALVGHIVALVRRSKQHSLVSSNSIVPFDIAITKCFISILKFAPSSITMAALNQTDPIHDDLAMTVGAIVQSLARYSLERDAACMEAMALGILIRLICQTPSSFAAVAASLLALPCSTALDLPSSLEWLVRSPPALSETVSIAIIRALISVVDHALLFEPLAASHTGGNSIGSLASLVVFPELQRLCGSTIDGGNRYALLGSVNPFFALAASHIKVNGG